MAVSFLLFSDVSSMYSLKREKHVLTVSFFKCLILHPPVVLFVPTLRKEVDRSACDVSSSPCRTVRVYYGIKTILSRTVRFQNDKSMVSWGFGRDAAFVPLTKISFQKQCYSGKWFFWQGLCFEFRHESTKAQRFERHTAWSMATRYTVYVFFLFIGSPRRGASCLCALVANPKAARFQVLFLICGLVFGGELVEFFFETFGKVRGVGETDLECHLEYRAEVFLEEFRAPSETVGPDIFRGGQAGDGQDFPVQGGAAHIKFLA